MRPWKGWLLAGLLLPFSLCAQAEPIGYAAGFDTLFRIDLATGAATRVGPIGFNDVEGLAFSPEGVLYGVADGTVGSGSGQTDFLIRIDPNTGIGSMVGALSGLSSQGTPGTGNSFELDYGLAFTCDGRLWLSSDTTGLFWEVQRGSGATRLIGNLGVRLSGLAARGRDLYGVSIGGGETLYRVNVETASVSPIGALGWSDSFLDAGLDFDALGRLWVTIDYFTPMSGVPPLRNDVGQIDLNTGRVQNVVSVTGPDSGVGTLLAAQMEGLAIAPPSSCSVAGPLPPEIVPGPGTPLLILLGAIAVLFGARRLRAARHVA